jgi:uncharacterized protein
MRKHIEFQSDGLKCKGWHYVPDSYSEGKKLPTVVMAHGFSAVKEMLTNYAERFVSAGLAVLLFDYRYLGEGEGEPRGQVLPHIQLDDYRNAISWVSLQAETDPERIGVWGSSYSGAHVLHLSAFDRRIKAAVAQVPGLCAWRTLLENQGLESLRLVQEMLAADRTTRYGSQTVNYLPVVAPEGQVSVLATPDAYEFFLSENKGKYENWINQVTFESVEKMIEYDPADAIELISPTPLLIVAAEKDTLIPIDKIREAFGRAKEPKKLVVIPCGHFDVYYDEPWHEQAIVPAVQWFVEHLGALFI